MKILFMFLAVSVFAVSVNARNTTNTTSKTSTTSKKAGTKCNIGYHEVNSKCVKLYCNDLPKKQKTKTTNSSAK